MLQKIYKTLSTVALLALAGCATTTPTAQYDAQASKALNLVRAGGIKQIEDQKVNATDYQRLTNNTIIADAGWTWTNYVNPTQGFSSGFGLGLGIATMLFKPTADSADSRLLVWMPSTLAKSKEEARITLRDIATAAISKGLDKAQIKFVGPTNMESKRGEILSVFMIQAPEIGCPIEDPSIKGKGQYCAVVFALNKLVQRPTPGFLKNLGTDTVYASVAGDFDYSSRLFVTQPKDARLNELQIYQSISQSLPEWMALYLAPEKVQDQNGVKVPAPFVLYQGEMNWFLKPVVNK
ncbi:hypothetical protein [Eoetvoesiella caeni]